MTPKQKLQAIETAREKGAQVGTYVRTMGWVAADQTIARAATGYVMRLPLNDMKLEVELRHAFIAGAIVAAESEVEG